MNKKVWLVLALIFACTEEPPPEEAVTLSDLMKTHYVLAEDIRDAIINGDVVMLHGSAEQLSKPVPVKDLPSEWEEHLSGMRTVAGRLDGQYDMKQAATDFADLAERCAGCHQMTGTQPELATYPIPPESDDLQVHMLRHAWAAARMWEGLIAPSDEKWVAGAQVVASEPLEAHSFIGRPAPGELAAMAEALHDLGKRAVDISTLAGRSKIYADFIGKCAPCHQGVRSARSAP